MADTIVNVNGINELDFTAASGVTASQPSPGVLKLDIAGSGGGGGSNLLASFGPGTVFTGNASAFQNILVFTIPASTIPAGGGIEFDFAAIGATGAFGTNLWQIDFNGTTLAWSGLTGTSGFAYGGCRIFNEPGSTTAQTFVLKPLQVNTTSAGINGQWSSGPITTTAFNTATALTFTLQWEGPNTITTQIIQAFVKLI